ncbi:MAG TPA: biopolymer transporter ExbD [Myxococcales bacterium]|nr:biopolymer transporter ExbD [Myxococcales bacterium]
MAAVSQGDGEDEVITGINVTPLVDITLVLLIIFMVTATYIVRRAIQVNLPKAANGGEVVGKTFMVIVKADGTVVLDGAPVSDAQLLERVRTEKAKDPEMRAVIAADGDSRHREVIHVIDVLKGEGITKFALDVEQADRAAAPSP